MALSTIYLFCSIILLNSYFSAAKISDPELTLTSITSTGFSVQWNEADFSESSGEKYTVTVDGPEVDPCDVEEIDCKPEGDPLQCTFSYSDESECTIPVNTQLLPCTELTVTVARGEKVRTLQFNLAPDAPVVTSLEYNDASVNKLTVTWEKPATVTCDDVVTGYTITTSPAGTTVADVDAEATTQELTGLTACTEYMVSVAAKWPEGTGEPGTNTGRTGSQDPDKPTEVTSNSTKSTEIELSWTASANINACPITNYKVTWTPGNDDGTTEGESITTTYTITGLSPITKYTIIVTTNTDDGKAAVSEEYIHTTTEDQVPTSVPTTVTSTTSGVPTSVPTTVTSTTSGAVTGLSGGEIAGIVCGSIAGVAIIAGVIFIYIKKMFCFAAT